MEDPRLSGPFIRFIVIFSTLIAIVYLILSLFPSAVRVFFTYKTVEGKHIDIGKAFAAQGWESVDSFNVTKKQGLDTFQTGFLTLRFAEHATAACEARTIV